MKVLIHTDRGNFGPINEGSVRTFWGYGLIPRGTLVTYGRSSFPGAIESCSELNAFPKRLAEDAAHFNSTALLSQRRPSSAAQARYLNELCWPFPVACLNYYQADFVRKRLEEAFPEKRRVFIDPDNPWSPGSENPLNLGDEEREERKYLRFLGVAFPEDAYLRVLRDLVSKYDTPEKRREYEEARHAWRRLPATNRQLKLLRFFGMSPQARLNRGTATSLITRILSDEDNWKRWTQYKLLTEDIGDESAELRPFDARELANVSIPFSDELSDAEASRAVVRTIRGRKKRMWDCLNSPVEYWTPWLKVVDMDAITKRAGIAALFDSGDIPKFKQKFIEELQSYSPEIADRERRHRL